MSALTADAVERVFAACLYDDEDLPGWDGTLEGLPKDAIVTEGILNQSAFDPRHVAEHRDEILAMLGELPHAFRLASQGGGGGWSFLNACMREDGIQWTGLHQTQDRLFQLGMAIGAAKYALPKTMWGALPGGMPYLIVDMEPK